MIKNVLLLLVTFMLLSCASVQKDVLYQGPEDIVFSELEELELQMVEIRAELQNEEKTQRQVQGDLDRISAVLNAMQEQASTDPVYRARLFSLSAEAALLSQDKSAARSFAEESRNMYAGDELNALVLSRLSDDLDQAEQQLREALLKSDNQLKIRPELAYVLEKKGEYREALSLYDSVLSRLDPAYARMYSASRDRSLALIDAVDAPSEESSAYLDDEPLKHIGMLIITRNESTLLDWYEVQRYRSASDLFRAMKDDAWFPDNPKQNDMVKRQDAALFLWRVIARDDATMLKRYTVRYAGRDGYTPVPDVPFDSPYFNAVLGVVEEGIMNLKDGTNFGGKDTLSGLEFFGMLNKAEQWH